MNINTIWINIPHCASCMSFSIIIVCLFGKKKENCSIILYDKTKKQKLIRIIAYLFIHWQFVWVAVKFYWLVTRFKWFRYIITNTTVVYVYAHTTLYQRLSNHNNRWNGIAFLVIVEWSIKKCKSYVIYNVKQNLVREFKNIKMYFPFNNQILPHTHRHKLKCMKFRLFYLYTFRLHCNYFHVNFPFHWIHCLCVMWFFEVNSTVTWDSIFLFFERWNSMAYACNECNFIII